MNDALLYMNYYGLVRELILIFKSHNQPYIPCHEINAKSYLIIKLIIKLITVLIIKIVTKFLKKKLCNYLVIIQVHSMNMCDCCFPI